MTTTSGTELIDTLIDGVHVGDNLVMVGDDDAPLDLIVDRFRAAATRAEVAVPVVIVAVRAPWEGPVPEPGLVLDLSAPGRLPGGAGRADAGPGDAAADLVTRSPDGTWTLAPEARLADALALLVAADEHVGMGAAFVFDELTAVQEAWGRDAALELFLATCPRLYRRRSLALWPVRGGAHGPAFLRRLTDITQVVVEFEGVEHREDTSARSGARPTDRETVVGGVGPASEASEVRLTVRKADGRADAVVGRRVRAEVADGDLRAIETPGTSRERLGTAIRDQRLARGASQADIARRVGISPSALSQIERGVRGPSGDTLMRLWEVLGVAFGPTDRPERGYRIERRSGRDRARLADGMVGERLADDPDAGEIWIVEVDAGASGSRAPFAVKTPETVLVLEGVLDLQFAGHRETLHEGDLVVVTTAAVTGWANPSNAPTRLTWTIHPAI